MGVKRPFEKEFPELSLKQRKQFDQDNKIILCEEDFPSAFTSQRMGLKRPFEEEFPELSLKQHKQFDQDNNCEEDFPSAFTSQRMGVKRSFEEEFPELSLKQHKHFDQDNKIILCEEDFPSAFTSQRMGVKRPFEEEFPELSLKQHKQFDQDNKIILCEEDFPSAFTSPNANSFGEADSGCYRLQDDSRLYGSHSDTASVDDKELETSAPLSWITSSSSEEDTGLDDATFGSYFQPYFDFSIPLQLPEQLENPYFSLFNCSPRKEIPVGPDRQAEVLPWGVNINRTQQKPTGTCTVPMPDDSTFESSLFSSVSKEVPVGPDHQAEVLPWDRNLLEDCLGSDVREQRLMGTCVTPMPDDSTLNGVKVGQCRTDCCCPDVGSIRCVRQHVKEARETLREAIGEESFSELGFYDMGEEVACKWNSNDERLFYEIIFSNPISRGRNFWKHLSAAFPTRTKNEIVSYYFNVFMLRKRATQNRSLLLEIDSDDDEWKSARGGDLYENRSHLMDSDMDDEDDDDVDHGADDEQVGVYEEFCQVGGAHDDSIIESFGNQDLRLSRTHVA